MRRRILEPRHVVLDAPHEAYQVPRPHFDPKSGWFRRIERATSLWLSRNVFPRLPGASIPYGWILERFLTVAEVDAAIHGLPAPFEGATILFVSDVHAGPFLAPHVLARAFAKLRTLAPDVVIHGGDLASSNVAECVPHAAALRSLAAPLGAYAILGNHDHYTRDVPGLADLYARCGVRLIDNDAVALERGGARIGLAGIDDWNFGRPDLPRAMTKARALVGEEPVVLASHNPDAFFEAARRGAALVLSGHTHGGQVRIPGRPVLVRMSRYRLDDGRYAASGCEIVVSRGLGVSGVPLRLFCNPEAALVTLRRAEAP